MTWNRIQLGLGILLWAAVAGRGLETRAADSRFAKTHSRSQYVHWIDLYDADGKRINTTDPDAPPYSPVHTCGRCHDYDAIVHGYHFDAGDPQADAGRPGEPWIWTDTRTGTQIPLSYRKWAGTYDPTTLGITPWEFVLQFGRQLPGGGPGERVVQMSDEGTSRPAGAAVAVADAQVGDLPGRWRLAGLLNVDCMFCHARESAYNPEVWWEQIQKQNFAWAPAAAFGLADIDGAVASLPDDFDPAKAEAGRATLPKTTYRPLPTNAQKKVFFDIVRRPSDNACYYCHTTRVAGPHASPDWTHDEDVHIRAGFRCGDCHRNGIDHQTVRGYQGEQHASGLSVATLSCRGCHLGETSKVGDVLGGRMGAPKPEHRGLPPLHLERLACTACHSGPRPAPQTARLETSMAHGLGLPTHTSSPFVPPSIVGPVLMQDQQMLFPYRAMWPAFWGMQAGQDIVPLDPEQVYTTLRRILRIRRSSTFTDTMANVTLNKEDKTSILGEMRAEVPESEWTDQERMEIAKVKRERASALFREKLVASLTELKKVLPKEGATPVYVSGGHVYKLGADDPIEVFDHQVAAPYAWKMAHDVRPARWSTGVKGCVECHSAGAPIFEGVVTALGPAPETEPVHHAMYELEGFDKQKLATWNLSFQGRPAFKWFAFISAGIVALIVLAFLLTLLNGLFGLVRR